MYTPVYARSPGTTDYDRAFAYLTVNRIGFESAPQHTQIQQTQGLVRQEQARASHAFLSGGAAAAEATANTAVGQLRGIIEGESFVTALKKAYDEDPKGVGVLLQSVLDALSAGAKPASKDGADVGVSASARLQEIQAYPGPNNVAKAIAMLEDKQEGFKLNSWSEKNRIAGNYVTTGVAR